MLNTCRLRGKLSINDIQRVINSVMYYWKWSHKQTIHLKKYFVVFNPASSAGISDLLGIAPEVGRGLERPEEEGTPFSPQASPNLSEFSRSPIFSQYPIEGSFWVLSCLRIRLDKPPVRVVKWEQAPSRHPFTVICPQVTLPLRISGSFQLSLNPFCRNDYTYWIYL